MLSLLLFSLLVGVVASAIIVPFLSVNNKEEPLSFNRWVAFGTLTVLSSIGVFIFYYVTNLDRNWTSLWALLLIVAILGAVVSQGMERKVKMVVSLVALLVGVYVLSAPLFTQIKSMKRLRWTQKVEITAFDETKTPASVPPKFSP